jgi:hypothetical protein
MQHLADARILRMQRDAQQWHVRGAARFVADHQP